nr:hypothetical protein [Escherichia coli]
MSKWKEFYANWKPKGCVENYQLTEKGHSLLQQLTEAGAL